MNNKPNKARSFFKTTCYFESTLILVAVVLGWVADINPFAHLYLSETALMYGILGTLPLFLLFLAMEHLQLKSIQQIRRLLLDVLGSQFYPLHWSDLLVLASIAGIAEETLFRGVIQPWMENVWSMNSALIASSILFGLVHAITPLYALLAFLVSLYLGLFLDYDGSRNLLMPIVIHGLYDFLAFMVIKKNYRTTLNSFNSK